MSTSYGHVVHPGFSLKSSCPGFLQKYPSSFRLYCKPLIILILQAEGCFRNPSAMFHFVWRRMKNRSKENEKSFGAELFIALCNERSLKDALSILHLVICCMIVRYPII